MLLKDNQMVDMALKEFIDDSQEDWSYPASALIAIEETKRFYGSFPDFHKNA